MDRVQLGAIALTVYWLLMSGNARASDALPAHELPITIEGVAKPALQPITGQWKVSAGRLQGSSPAAKDGVIYIGGGVPKNTGPAERRGLFLSHES